MKGPDLTNNLRGVLLRFRKDAVAVIADIQQMFYCFSVRPDHRDFLRFYWYEKNEPSCPLVEYRMTKHVFGNSPSPAVARTASEAEAEYGSDVGEFVRENFYVDDGLASLATPKEATDLFQRTQGALSTAGIRLHKICSNSPEVFRNFSPEDLAQDLKDLDLGCDSLPSQRSLGLCWDSTSDTFSFKVSEESKPYTRRGVLSKINSLFDPLGFLGPITMQDDVYSKIHIFADASENAKAAVAYLQTIYADGSTHISFLLGKTKVAPKHGHSIPRLELCAALMALEIGECLSHELSLTSDCMNFYSDSKVVLGYLQNTTRRFYVYVSNRVERILRFSNPKQWFYVESERNPADQGTRGPPASALKDSLWILGPSYLSQPSDTPDVSPSRVEYWPLILKINLEETLTKAAKLFYQYCKKTVEESFLMIDPPKIAASKR
ncbi:uncharacterized protein [Argopecten irradians]|uniref:uncharacterized protein n=1 Tax=Argopecten irradians TaxID=31199 RepID=UPI0037193EEB